MRLGIDFGTTRTVVAAVEGGNYPFCTFTWGDDFKEYIPSLAAHCERGCVFGWDAVAALADPRAQVVRSFKRLAAQVRPEDQVELAPGCQRSLMELTTSFLLHVAEQVRHHGNVELRDGEPLAAMVAVPANAPSNQRYLTLEAFRRAGFNVLGMMNEPTAAALEFVNRFVTSSQSRSARKYVVVYDLGGGTFDTAAVGLADRHYEVITHTGIARLGGDDFDEVILEHVLRELGLARAQLAPADAVRLLEECRERKEGLRPNTSKIVIDAGAVLPGQRSVVVSTAEVYAACAPLIERSIDAVATILLHLQEHSIDPDDSRSLAGIYLVGGAVAFPPVARALRERFDRKVKIAPVPHAATAMGLAIAADPEARVTVHERVTRCFGVWREDEAGRSKVFDPIFEKNTRAGSGNGPLVATRTYRPVHNIGHLRFMECSALGTSGEPCGDLMAWQDIRVPYDPRLVEHQALGEVAVVPRPDLAEHEVVERYVYDQGGQVHVEIENRATGARHVFTLSPSQWQAP